MSQPTAEESLTSNEKFKAPMIKENKMMNQEIHIVNHTSELKDCRKEWTYNKDFSCWCLEDILYTKKPAAPKFQRMSIFVPAPYMADGELVPEGRCGNYKAINAPVVFENNSAGYAEMEHTKLGGDRNYAKSYLEAGMVYVTCGCRGRQTTAANGTFIGKAPTVLVDLKMAIRFLRHNKEALPGDLGRIISIGWSAGGAMSSLLGVTGNAAVFGPLLRDAGAFMEETDDVFAAQVYCPIIDLEHADLMYEWQYRTSPDYEDSPFEPGGSLTALQKALSGKLSDCFILYFNGMQLKNPKTGETLSINEDGRSGNGYDFLMEQLSDSATVFLGKLSAGELKASYDIEQYLKGDYTYEVPDFAALEHLMKAMKESGKAKGAGVPEGEAQEPGKAENSYEGHGIHVHMPKLPMKTLKGDDTRGWLSWDGKKARVASLDAYTKEHRKRMKNCPSFDFLSCLSGENQEFGDEHTDFVHFDPAVADLLDELKDAYPEEYKKYYPGFAKAAADEKLKRRCDLINPFYFIGRDKSCRMAEYFRINVGSKDADTSFMASLILYLKLAGIKGCDAQYHLIWDQPHSEADYPGEAVKWIEFIV